MGRISLNSVQHSMEKSLQVKVIGVSVTSPAHVPIKILMRKFSPLLSNAMPGRKNLFNDISIERDNSAVNQSYSAELKWLSRAVIEVFRGKLAVADREHQPFKLLDKTLKPFECSAP